MRAALHGSGWPSPLLESLAGVGAGRFFDSTGGVLASWVICGANADRTQGFTVATTDTGALTGDGLAVELAREPAPVGLTFAATIGSFESPDWVITRCVPPTRTVTAKLPGQPSDCFEPEVTEK